MKRLCEREHEVRDLFAVAYSLMCYLRLLILLELRDSAVQTVVTLGLILQGLW